jgi:hypothetical protein
MQTNLQGLELSLNILFVMGFHSNFRVLNFPFLQVNLQQYLLTSDQGEWTINIFGMSMSLLFDSNYLLDSARRGINFPKEVLISDKAP